MKNGKLPASFRDPDGFVYKKDGVVLRQVNSEGAERYDAMMSELYPVLVEKRLLISHEEIDVGQAYSDDAYRVLKPQQVDFISYPYEWSFEQLKDAALLTLRIQKIALKLGFTLKDASAYNIQFIGTSPVFIDTLSFEAYQPGKPWDAYRQFCQHFVAPLALAAYRDVELLKMLRDHLDGIPLPLASKLLPFHTYLRFGLQMHLHLHGRSVERYENPEEVTKTEVTVSKKSLLSIVDSLRGLVDSLNWGAEQTDWANYYEGDSYEAAAFEHKKQVVSDFLRLHDPDIVWDLGANTGVFSQLTRGIQTIAWDVDAGAVQRHYQQLRKDEVEHILPLVQDLTNPSPGLGWMQVERRGFYERAEGVDMVLALALIHHIVIGNNVPMGDFAASLARIAPLAIVEFVPKADPKVKRLLAARNDIFTDYHRAGWEEAIAPYFSILQTVAVNESERTLYLLKGRSS